MGTQPHQHPRILFDGFTYDRPTGELRKHGTRLRLAGQPLQILEMLLEQPGEVVAREELQQRLWKGTTFVDFEHGLNAAINKLRQALGDSADQPRYIETLPGKGYRFIAELRTAPKPVLEMVASAPSEPAPLAQASPRFPKRAVVVSGAALLGITALLIGMRFAAGRSGAKASPAQTMRFRIAIPEGIKLSESQNFRLSPDGKTLVYLALGKDGVARLWAQPLDSLEPRFLRGTEISGGDPPVFFSPDSKYVVFYSDEKLKRTDLSGNPPQVICRVPGIVLGGSWSREGTIIFGTVTGGIMRVPAAGGEAVAVTTRDPARAERVHASPTFLPDGRHFLYSRLSSQPENDGVFVGSLDLKPEQQELRRLVATSTEAQFVASPEGNGKLLFLRDRNLWAQEFDTSRLELSGEPALVADHVGNTRVSAFFSASTTGALVHRNALQEVARLAWFDRHGQRIGSLGEPLDLDAPPVLSPDGTRVAMVKFDGGSVDVWVHDLVRDVSQRLTFDPALDGVGAWSSDGQQVAFSSSRAGHYDLYQVRANGEGGAELLYASNENKFATSWSADGHFLVYETRASGTKSDIWALRLDGTSKNTPVPLLHTPADESSGRLSANGRWLAYVSDESGTAEVYVQPFTPASGGTPAGPKLLVSRGGGSRPHWQADGNAIFYRSPDGTLMSVRLQEGPAVLKATVPEALFHFSGLWDAAGDGNRFLVAVPDAQAAPPPFTMVLNWQTELKK